MPDDCVSVTVQQILNSTRHQLSSDSADLDAELLLCHVLGVTRTWLRTWPEKPVSPQQLDQLAELLKRRQQGEPIAYILGQQEFWSLLLKVTPHTLIPRPETELLVEQALAQLHGVSHPMVLDLGTGSGAIALAIASERPDATVIASDFSVHALLVATENARTLSLHNVFFVNAYWANCFKSERFDLVLSNPPYIEQDDPDISAEVKKYEPTSALIAAEGGLADIMTISTEARSLLKQKCWLMLEHGWKQADAVGKILKKCGFIDIATSQDLAGHDRVSKARRD